MPSASEWPKQPPAYLDGARIEPAIVHLSRNPASPTSRQAAHHILELLAHIEHGRIHILQPSSLVRICRCLDISRNLPSGVHLAAHVYAVEFRQQVSCLRL